MQDTVITHIDQVTSEWLTSILAGKKMLTHGTVAAIDVDTGQGNWSQNARLIVKYSDGASGLLPRRLFLKMVNVDLDEDESFGESEVTYYTRDYTDVQNAPLLQCYDAAYSEKLKRYHILLDDVSETHVVAGEKAPTLEYGFALADGLAALHTRWWGAQRLAEANQPIHSDSHIQRFIDYARPGVDHILKHPSIELKQHWPAVMQELFAKHPQAIIKRSHNPNGFTLIHGDVGSYNILVPRSGDRPIYIIDRQPFNWSLTTWLGVYDIAYAIVLDWTVERRRQHEIPILERYYDHLIQNGVANYPWERLYDDYRLCVAMCVYIATEYCRGGVNKQWFHVWLEMLQRSLTACDDLDCRALW